jgi:hypothetical protein
MSLFALTLAGEIRSARKALAASAPGSAAALAAALNHADDCLADLERAERLLEQETASAEAARAALDRALQLAEIEAEQQRRADEAADLAAPAAPMCRDWRAIAEDRAAQRSKAAAERAAKRSRKGGSR